MRNPLLSQLALLLVLVASTATARDREKVTVRTLLLTEHPSESAHRVYVSGQVATVLRFEQPCEPSRTKLLGWEGRFEPLLVGGKKVVIEPLRDLAPDEDVPLLVTLADGTEIAFLLRPPSPESWGRPDQQVNVFKDRESYDAMLSTLYDTLQQKRQLEQEVERLRTEETSADHALASLLVSGASKQTLFQSKQTWFVEDADSDIMVTVYSGKGKAAVVVNIKNRDPVHSWRLSKSRLSTVEGGDVRPVALRAERPEIPPGKSGSFAFVADRSAFLSKGRPENLILEFFRQDGLRQGYVVLDHRLARE
ncbi:DUF2381 family protein [Pyxidicoccus fallax]|uniref:DUF2381 family protein n=1 Tax=Pyxidicoccus fallax TaxID=394095 RepID=A0A848LJ46_9BACT|nr:DUF2381 family protein [Pyxidicoccus fallax]NMO17742.1 DUF2381 family protein [Pyxidicoccus fallax]NPC84609.1 DUF2381 family protein [Pyxidicoccus fallax]